MKPISIRFQCFGPYMGEQFIDFTKLEKNGLFLICGETGSGKTTILDAMCYALYGKSSGGLRDDMSVMRCKLAKPQDETFVEYIFESGQQRYRFFRSLKPPKKQDAKTKLNLKCECQMLVDGDFVPLPDAKGNPTFLNAKAEQLIGLTYAQFRQVIILPQGQFEQLLVSKSEDKEKILVTLFHAERWQKIANRMHDLAAEEKKALEQEKREMETRLRVYGCETLEELEAKTVKEKEELDGCREELKSAEQERSDRQKESEAAQLANLGFAELDKRERLLKDLLSQKEIFTQEEERLSRADRAESIALSYGDWSNARKEKREKEQACRNASANQAKAEKELSVVLEQQKAHESRRESHLSCTQRLAVLNHGRELYRSLEEKKKARKNAEAALTDWKRKVDGAEKLLEAAVFAYDRAAEERSRGSNAYSEGERKYRLGIGGILAQKLEDGEPCPVCGSRTHPSPAQPIEGHITDQELNDLGEALKSAINREDEARKKYKEAEEERNRIKETWEQKQQEFNRADGEYGSAMGQRIQGVETEKELMQEIETLTRSISDFEKEDTQMQKRISDAHSAVVAAKALAAEAESAFTKAEEKLDEAASLWETARNGAGFGSDEAYLMSSMDREEKECRKKKLSQFQGDMKKAKTEYEEKRKELEGQERPDVAGAKARQEEAEVRKSQLERQLAVKEYALRDMEKERRELEKRMEAYKKGLKKNEASLVFATRLRGDSDIGLQRYVLGVMLTSITAAANQLLKTVYSGRYQLQRSNESSGSTRKRGLELDVVDSSGRRSVTTLSGGEKFLLSLSLAIGLSAVVQAQGKNGGIRLGAMFIDEGFGSLDRKSVDDALEALQSIRRSAGLVGIISHVDRLAETIPAKIQITKTKEGSQCKICC